MAQDVNMVIELRPGNQGHLHIRRHPKQDPRDPPLRIRLTPPGDPEDPTRWTVNWNVSVDDTIPSPAEINLTAVSIWFPHVSPLFIQSIDLPIPVREVTIPLRNGSGTAVLTLNRDFNREGLANNVDFVLPLAIYCTVDGGQGGNPRPGFHQRGRQMIDGHHSHPECNVGP